MHIICLTPLAPGVYNDHKADHITAPPEGWAYIPEDFPLPSTFPRLSSIEAEELTYTRTVEVPMTREVPVLGEDGTPVLDEKGNPVTKAEQYTGTEERPYTMMTVTSMEAGTLPEPVEPSAQEQIAALKEQLADTDYQIIKCSEYQLAGLEAPYDIALLHAKRQELRDQINALAEGTSST